LDGSGSSDPDGDVLSYAWTALSGDAMSNATVARPTFAAGTAGSYRYVLVVNDGAVDSGPDTAVVTVQEVRPPGKALTVALPGGATMDFVWIDPGTLAMGTPDADPEGQTNEKPQHAVTITKGYYLGKYEITQGQWSQVVSTPPWSGQANADHPAGSISWDDVQEFIAYLNAAAGDSLYRLPTEAEWEYACRAGTTTWWSFGDDASPLGEYAWYYPNACGAGECYAHRVGLKKPNPWGLYDMHGNVWEWVQDWYGGYSSGSQTDPQGPSSGAVRVYRGGAYDMGNDAYTSRSASRGSYASGTGYRYPSLGARLLRMDTPLQPNQAPTANAGSDQSAAVGTTVQLDGSKSSDPDPGEVLTYRWTGPPAITLSDAADAQPRFDAHAAGVLPLVLVVNDGQVDSAPDTVVVTVKPQPPVNRPPAANAGSDGTAELGQTVQLDGSGSRDPDAGAVLSYRWAASSGITLDNATVARPTFTPSAAGVHELVLVVNDGQVDSAPDTVVVTVVQPNRAPQANAGPDQTAALRATVVLDGSGSSDPDGDLLAYQWDAPPGVTLDSATAVRPTFAASAVGSYGIALGVNDGTAGSASDTVVITVQGGTTPARTLTADLPGGATMAFVWVEPGTFTMGAPDMDQPHAVQISKGFWAGAYEITQGQWEAALGTRPWSGYSKVREGPDYPAVFISWNYVQAFIHQLNRAAGDSLYRLPTEAEWEYACRAGTTTRWSFGDDERLLGEYAWYEMNTVGGEAYPHTVGTKLPNPWGLYDMHGNVWEWVQDWYELFTGESQMDPTGPVSGSRRVMRGGGYDYPGHDVRSAFRGADLPDVGGGTLGARLVRLTEPVPVNSVPTADAGPDQSAATDAPVRLDGSGSRDADGDTLMYRWTALPGVALSSATVAAPTLTASAAGTYQLVLVVNDGQVDSAPDTVVVTLVVTLVRPNRPPVAGAGEDQTVDVGATVQLDGSGSSDPDADPLTYRWASPAGISLSSATVARPTFTASAAGTYQFVLAVEDGHVYSAPDTVVFTVQEVTPPAPVANAGPGQVAEVGATVQLDGGGSAGAQGGALTYRWMAPAGVRLSSATVAGPTFAASVVGAFDIALVVNDGRRDSAPDTVRITVRQPNRAPLANAGPDQTSVDVGATVLLDGTGSLDSDGGTLTYRWTAPPGLALSSTTDARTSFPAVAAGTYQVSLVVSDGLLESAPDTVEVRIAAPPLGLVVDLPGGATMEFVWIEPGTFTMGSPPTEPGRGPDESPQHQVTISRGFWLAKYEVTQGQWESVMGTRPWSGQSNVKDDSRYPAVYIAWEDVQEMLARLNADAGTSLYRAPTEAEWEYACRAGTTTPWSFGDDPSQLGEYAWFGGNAFDVGLRYAQAVGTKRRNPWGLYDMHGNVWEWVQDWYSYYPEQGSPAVDPQGAPSGRSYVYRGGSFISNASETRSARRGADYPGYRVRAVGARLVRLAEPVSISTVPVANAGTDQVVTTGTPVQLDGTESRDTDGAALTYRWTAPAKVSLSDSTAAQPTFTASTAGTYQVTLVVNDGHVDSVPDTVVFTVQEATPPHTLTVDLPGGATMEFVWIEPGTFTMGAGGGGPQHQVTITRGYYMGKAEITQRQWEAVTQMRPWSGQTSVQSRPSNPAVYISWSDVQEQIHHLNQAAGDSLYRLPAEAEWEYACRAGTTTMWSFGDDASQLGQYAWYFDNAFRVGEPYAHGVGTKLPNPWGLFDMHGNVREWVQDWFGDYSSAAQVDPLGPDNGAYRGGTYRVARNGSYNDGAGDAASAYRDNTPPDARASSVGARLVRLAQPVPMNYPPEAAAGPDQSANVGSIVQLGGGGSSDPDADALTYGWTAPSGITLSDATAARPSFAASAAGTYSIVLVVNDGKVDSAPDTVSVTVQQATPPAHTLTADLPGGATMDFVWIDPGTFTMGTTEEQGQLLRSKGLFDGWFLNEMPAHLVTLTKGYYLADYEVTQGQWEAAMGTRPWSGQEYVQENPNNPAVYISWDGVQELVHRLNQAAGDSLYRMATEAEWEYACRAGTTTLWSFGDDETRLGAYSWYRTNAWDRAAHAAQLVGQQKPNPWGLYDMYGNVWEWCQDWYGSYPSDAQIDPPGPKSGDVRVVRSGDFLDLNNRVARSALRDSSYPNNQRYFYFGARLVRIR
jgi:formylglycine-generating enzyme required for sulfatase activity